MQGIISAAIGAIGKALDIIGDKHLTQVSRDLLAAQMKLLEEERKPYSKQNDALIENLYEEIEILMRAMETELRIFEASSK